MLNAPLKFRAYDHRKKRFMAPAELSNLEIYIDNQGRLCLARKDATLLMFTYMEDSSGVPLYEMDVVEIDVPTQFGVMQKKGVMQWIHQPGMFSVRFDSKMLSGGRQTTHYAAKRAEKVGNYLEDNSLLSDEQARKMDLHTMHEAVS